MIIGIERFGIPTCRTDGIPLTITVLLVRGENNDIAAYIGHGPDAWVLTHGDKVPESQVDTYFPGFRQRMAEEGLTYRG